ncbi:MAG: DUF1295 domain-containing protein [Maricaulaceae bacterium]
MADLIFQNFGQCAAALLCALTLLWLISLAMKDASIIDIFWGFGFLIVGALCYRLANLRVDYIVLMAAMPILWGLRLTLYLAKRNLGHGEDTRYVAMRKRSGMSEMKWRVRALFTIYFGQGLLIMIVSAPVWVAMATGQLTPVGALAIIGAVLWLIGFLFEAIGDAQLASFIKKNKGYDGPYEDKPVLDTGLWKYTRHPNYFGNACMWWGIWIAACQAPWGWATIFAPLVMTFLLTRVSGRDLLERQLKKRPAYTAYMARTSSFIPMPPKKG